MRLEEFKPDDVVAYLNQELPGFEPSIVSDSFGTDSMTLKVRAVQVFAAYAALGNEVLMFPLPNYHLQRAVDEFIRKTRLDMIHKLGLQKQIDAEVQQSLQRERQNIENAAYQRAYRDALSQVAREARDAEDARAARLWNTFMGRDLPSKKDDDDRWDGTYPDGDE